MPLHEQLIEATAQIATVRARTDELAAGNKHGAPGDDDSMNRAGRTESNDLLALETEFGQHLISVFADGGSPLRWRRLRSGESRCHTRLVEAVDLDKRAALRSLGMANRFLHRQHRSHAGVAVGEDTSPLIASSFPEGLSKLTT